MAQQFFDNPTLNRSAQEDTPLERIRAWIYDNTGIYFPENKTSLLQQRLNHLALKLGYRSLLDLEKDLKTGKHPDIHIQIANAATTNHTHFYREETSLNFFRDHIYPTLIDKKQIRIWSAAASSGEELYTLAIILAEKAGLNLGKHKFALLGTDINGRVIKEAEQGLFPKSRVDPIDQSVRQKWFEDVGMGYFRIRKELREWAIFRRLNLNRYPWPFANAFQVVFLRNVLYYFDKPDQATLLKRIYDHVESGGWLITSVTESISELDLPWQYVKPGVYRK